jgi:ribosomal protein S27AE
MCQWHVGIYQLSGNFPWLIEEFCPTIGQGNKYSMTESRKTCPACKSRPVAIAYHRGEKTYYRNRCDWCIRHNKKEVPTVSAWVKTGYTKKPHCERCGFVAKHRDQLLVAYLDGDLTNGDVYNLKTICQNCKVAIKHERLAWRHEE